jgi:hypothetical protein
MAGFLLLVVFVPIVLYLYFLPTIVAVRTRTLLFGPVLFVNFFFGWMGIGWIMAMAMAIEPGHEAPQGTWPEDEV